MDTERLVEAGYDRIADHYLATNTAEVPETLAAPEGMARRLPHGRTALDLSCGAAAWALGRSKQVDWRCQHSS